MRLKTKVEQKIIHIRFKVGLRGEKIRSPIKIVAIH